MVEGALVINPARSLDAVFHAIAQMRQIPFREGHSDDRNLQIPSFRHRIERREDHLVGEIARHTEEHQRVRTRGSHEASPLGAVAFSTWPPNAQRIAESTLSAKSASPRELKRS